MEKTVKELKSGDFFTLKEYAENRVVPENSVWVRGEFERSTKKYSCCKFSDMNHENFFKGDRIVYTDFDF